MSAREAYIAGRSGGSRPRDVSTGSPGSSSQRQQEQNAYDAGRQERQREQTIKQEGIQGLSQRDQEQAKTIAQNVAKQGIFKDPYNTLTREEQINAGYPKTGIEKLQETTGTKIISPTIQLMAGAGKGMQVLLDKIFKPSVEDFNDPVVLAAMNRLFEEKKKELGEEGGNQFKKDYLKNYKDKLNEALTPQLPGFEQEQGFGILDEAGIASLFDDKLADAAAAAQSGALGKGVQRINFPKEFYMDDGKGIMPQTTDGLEDLARLDTKGLEGTNPDLVKMIFNARAILDQNKGNQGGGGAGIPSIATAPTPFTDVNNNGILDNLEVAQATTTPVTATTPVTGIPSLTPTTINYASMAPQFGSQYPGYVNQGLMNQNLSPYYDNLRNYYGIG